MCFLPSAGFLKHFNGKNQEYNQNVKQFAFRPGLTFRLVGSGSTLVANVISSRCRQAINIYLRNKETQQSLQLIVNIKCNASRLCR